MEVGELHLADDHGRRVDACCSQSRCDVELVYVVNMSIELECVPPKIAPDAIAFAVKVAILPGQLPRPLGGN